ncbi:heavy metal translocating P-type ATPase [Pseudochrobactrum sp. HB0163]|uniref:heavy metal translocating P-type ATPase n=1 Tax=Pseudochrobactrum sp. HB0163 TaxID=3450708 RepID=UPI003F6E2981
MSAPVRQDKFRIEGMDCASCAQKIDTAVRRLGNKISDVTVSVTKGTMTVTHKGIEADAIMEQLKKLGYQSRYMGENQTPARPEPETEPHRCSGAHDHEHSHEGHDHGAQQHGLHVHATGKIKEAPVLHMHDHGEAEDGRPWWQQGKARLTMAAGAALMAAYIAGHFLPQYALYIFSAAMLVGLVPIARRALAGARFGTPFSIETLMTIAAIGALIIGAVEEAAMVVFLFLIGEMLEGVAARRARNSIRGLADLVPKTARAEENGRIVERDAADLAIGTIIQVRPGDRIAADGEVLSGNSAVNEAPVTGESTPKNKEAGDKVFAGTINSDAVLRVRVTATAQNNTIARIIAQVEEAQESKAPTERFIDRFSVWYTPAVMILAALVAIIPPLVAGSSWDEWIYKGLAILLIGCPCALVISTPAAIAAGLSSGARRGLLMKGGAVLESAGHVTAAAFDKTGTLTEGKPVVTDIIAFTHSEADILRFAAAVEQGSSHPLALAILKAAQTRNIALPQVHDGAALGGKGVTGTVEGKAVLLASPKAVAAKTTLTNSEKQRIAALNDQGKTVSLLMIGDELAGGIAMRDEPREDARQGIKTLQTQGIRTIMLTGDNRRTAEAIGRDLGMEVHAEMMPEDKRRIVDKLKTQKQIIAKIGDGINDAPALAAADLGIAIGGGTDVALETADAAIMHGRVTDVANMIALSRATMANIKQNITLAIGLKLVFLITTIAGITGLWPAILADTGATVLVTANAMRLLRWKP